jgi:D-proline reductase (dithiol) PrdB
MGRLKNKILAKILTKHPSLVEKFTERIGDDTDPLKGVDLREIPWTPLKKSLAESRVAIVTTAGVHLKEQTPFDMEDKNGDPTFRVVPADTPLDSYTITHDYYDHTDADKDLNIVFPVERLAELLADGVIGELAPRNFSFMGHIDGPYVGVLMEATAKEVATKLNEDGTDIALLTPG